MDSFENIRINSRPSAWDWNRMLTWKGRAKTIKDSEYLSDCAIVLSNKNDGNEKVYNLHRIFVESASPEFQRLFRESEEKLLMGGKCTITISDITPQIMEIILRYVYLDEVEIRDLDQALELLGSASNYKIFGLTKLLSPRIITQIKPDNVLKIYKYACQWNKQDLMEGAMSIICRDADVLVDTMEFLELSEECLIEILKRDDLGISSELRLYLAVKRWGEVRCERTGLIPTKDDNLRKVLRNLVGLIRFPLMDQEEFTLNVGVNNNILDMNDMVSILLYFTVSKDKRGCIPPGKFNSTRRFYPAARDFGRPTNAQYSADADADSTYSLESLNME